MGQVIPQSGSFQLTGTGWTIDKDPVDILDYGIELQYWLEPGDSLPSPVTPFWTLPVGSGLTIVTQEVVQDPVYGPIAYVLLSGGVLGALESAICVWVTANGLQKKQTLFFNMVAN